ncbi:SusC/RagA family TonB-linked outer membrane protein [Sinomicrobium pectinilyticum]|uniref:SusC/RagA family TonB-linked outer membrane protein n=1 Tax=Sinomicrobium pectinilyticum TaxID=1084421 RepID=A0A3N0EA52_SINP1|nr:TonB-dependent receptor [Sinomicrobium pectinilyticum]RNL84713.1 SusC/RagA family TonB-linked outer membrane protein [Sinomicrobium pectinilyticum]
MKNHPNERRRIFPLFKFDLKMRLTVLFFLVVLCGLHANNGYSQKNRITLDAEHMTVRHVIDHIESTTDYRFIYKTRHVDLERKVTLKVEKGAIETVLDRLFADILIGYRIRGTHIILRPVPGKKSTSPERKDPESTEQDPVQVSGTVTDAEGVPLLGASILEKGTDNGTQSDFDGNFSIAVKDENAVLVISYIGFKSLEIPVDGRTSIAVTLNEDAAMLDEVVVIGYGTQRRSQVVGAVDQVADEAFQGRSSVNTTQALQGKSPALVIQQTNSEPGAGLNLNVRGVSTFGDNSPLVVIDGIVGGDINALNPADIESISVLKDAGSAAIYGSRASNGVVLITTKKGSKESPLTVTYNGLVGYNVPHYFTRPVHGYENAMLRNEAALNSNETSAVFTAEQIRQFRENGDEEWFADEIIKPALQQNHNVSVSGGNENSTYLVSLGYMDQRSNFVGPSKGMERYNYRINLTNDYGKFKLTSTLAYTKQKITDHSSSTGTLMVDAFRVPLYYRQKDEEGNYLINDVLREFNPLGILEQGGFRKYDNDDVFGNISAELRITDNFKLRGVFGGRLYSNNLFSRTKEVDFVPAGIYGATRETNDESYKSLDLNTQFIAEYTKVFADLHDVNVLLGVSNENHSDRKSRILKRYTDPDLGTPTGETVIVDTDSYNSNDQSAKNSLNSLFGRASYNYDHKYFAEFSFRYDGSSKFRKEKRWGFFPSMTLGYQVTREDFMQGYRDNFGNIKLRASYGILGNQNVGNYQYQTTYFTFSNAYGFNNNAVGGAGFNFANPDIQWERAATFNAGVDMDFLEGALSLSFDYFDKVTSDILVAPAVPGVYGTDLPDFNAGKVGNRGWEVSATYRHYGELFRHSVTFNIGDSKNKVLDFQGKEILTQVEELQVLLREGLPFNSYVGLKRDGYFQNYEEISGAAVPEGLTVVPGDNRYVDVNSDGVIDDDDKFVFGNPFPRYTYGFTYNLGFKNLDLSIFLQGVGKRTMMIRGELVEPFHYNYGMTMYTHQLDYWTPQNTDARYPRLANNGSPSNTNNFRRGSDMYLYDGAYLRLKNLQIGYTLPAEIAEKLGMKSYRVYFSGQNLFTLSKVKFVDPELSEFNNRLENSGANSGRAYPTLVYYGLGIDISF